MNVAFQEPDRVPGRLQARTALQEIGGGLGATLELGGQVLICKQILHRHRQKATLRLPKASPKSESNGAGVLGALAFHRKERRTKILLGKDSRTMKRIFTLIVLLGIVMSAVLTGCDKGPDASKPADTNAVPAAPAMPSTNK